MAAKSDDDILTNWFIVEDRSMLEFVEYYGELIHVDIRPCRLSSS